MGKGWKREMKGERQTPLLLVGCGCFDSHTRKKEMMFRPRYNPNLTPPLYPFIPNPPSHPRYPHQ